MKTKSKYYKPKCKTCIYHGTTSGMHSNQVFCSYSTIAEDTCLKKGNKGEIIDQRGDEFYNCKLYESGKKKRSSMKWMV